MPLGMQESYDPYISFRHHTKISSSIRPTYIFSGVFDEVLFSISGHGNFLPKNHGVWNPDSKTIKICGTGQEV